MKPSADERQLVVQKRERGRSLIDYLGYGVTLGTWFHSGDKPIEVMTMVDEPAGLEVDEHSVTVARYAKGLSKYEHAGAHLLIPGCCNHSQNAALSL